ncbi:MAG TPA: hypothetical protein VMF55_02665 [Solirubrobacterales bacterium]|nr:hypothetical protein [Solirubrobacterales bacterium]
MRKTFARLAEAKSWRAEAKRSVDQGTLRTPTRRTLAEVAGRWLTGAEAGDIRNRSGQRYKPATLRGYRQALDTYLLPRPGWPEIEHGHHRGPTGPCRSPAG